MLNKINIKHCFTHADTTIEFKKGLSRLGGANETGKSLVFEMIRYALFGTKALRGKATDYKKVEVTLDFTVNGVEYQVYRGPKEVVLNGDNKFIARSTTAVNAKIIEIIGYGLHTFDNVNNITQNEIEKLTKMDAKERKRFLDQLVKVSQIDDLIREYDGEAKLAAAEAAGMKNGIYNVDAPQKPAGYSRAETAENLVVRQGDVVRKLEEAKTRHDLLWTQAKNIIILPDPYPSMTMEALNDALDKQEDRAKLNKDVVRLYEAALPIADFRKYLETCGVLRELAAVQKPSLSKETIAATRQKWIEQDNWDRLTKLRERIAEMESCPRCGLSFEDEKLPLIQMVNELEPVSRPHRGLVSKEALDEKEAEWKAWDSRAEPDAQYAAIVRYTGNQPTFDEKTYNEHWAVLVGLEGLPSPKEINQSLASKNKVAEKERLLSEAQTLDFSGLSEAYDELKRLIAVRQASANYDSSVKYWDQVQQKNAEMQARIEKAEEEAAEKKKVVKALQDFKYYINTYFLPSVAKAASRMLRTMTNGVRKKLHISDKFDILVDGQAVETMSGSAKALVNIALRLALQYVLTKNTFSVFMGDEIDASMDSDRAKYLAECLNNTTDHIKQIIVISHRDITADHQIAL